MRLTDINLFAGYLDIDLLLKAETYSIILYLHNITRVNFIFLYIKNYKYDELLHRPLILHCGGLSVLCCI